MYITRVSSPRFRSSPAPLPSGGAQESNQPAVNLGQLLKKHVLGAHDPRQRARYLAAIATTRQRMEKRPPGTPFNYFEELEKALAEIPPQPTSELALRWAITRVMPKGLFGPEKKPDAFVRYRAEQEKPIGMELFHAYPESPLLKAEVKLPLPVSGQTSPTNQKIKLDVDLMPMDPANTNHAKMFRDGIDTEPYYTNVETLRQYLQATVLPVITECLKQTLLQNAEPVTAEQLGAALKTPPLKGNAAAMEPTITERKFGVIELFGKQYQVTVRPYCKVLNPVATQATPIVIQPVVSLPGSVLAPSSTQAPAPSASGFAWFTGLLKAAVALLLRRNPKNEEGQKNDTH